MNSNLVLLIFVVLGKFSTAQHINYDVIFKIKLLTDSLQKQEVAESELIGGHLCFFVKAINSKTGEVKIVISKIYNYYDLKYFDYTYIQDNKNYYTLYWIDSAIVIDNNITMFRQFKDDDHILMQKKLTNSSIGGVLSHSRDLTYKLNKNNELEVIHEVILINNQEFYKYPVRITKDKWK